MFPEHVETDRLHLERLSTETVDVDEYYEICSADPDIDEVTAFTPWDSHETPDETVAFLESRETAWADATAAEYVIRPRAGEAGAGEIAGACGLGIDWERRTGELGIWLRKRFWGRGYSGERAGALLELAFERLDLECIVVLVRVDNDRSLRAVERYVDRFGGSRDCVCRNELLTATGEPVDAVRYAITRDAYADADDQVSVTMA
ncbi:GNAT family N-acetyltransferase [Natribaculum luteum]|uniref:GNAT family N-acetyltransferase n=1 Tax=Natribaculum luteum TaxID=1586232 RepID=A0ABD5P3E8_9EURY